MLNKIDVFTKDEKLYSKIKNVLKNYNVHLETEILKFCQDNIEDINNIENNILIIDRRVSTNFNDERVVEKLSFFNKIIFIEDSTKEDINNYDYANLINENNIKTHLVKKIEEITINMLNDKWQLISAKEKLRILDYIYYKSNLGAVIIKVNNSKYDITYNKYYEKFLKINDDEKHFSWFQTSLNEDQQIIESLLKNIDEGKIDSYSLERRFVRRDGKIVWGNVSLTVLREEDPKKYTIFLLINDINDRKQLQIDLTESENQKNILLVNLPGLVFRSLFDDDWTIDFISNGCYSLTGYKAEDFYKKRITYNEIIVPSFRQSVKNAWEKAVELNSYVNIEYQILTKSGKIKWVLEHGEAALSSNDEVLFLEGVILDITNRKEIEQTLKYKTNYDSNTNLLNRDVLINLLSNVVNKKRESQALIAINIPKIYSLISSYGYKYVLDLIRKISTNLTKITNQKRVLYYGGDRRFLFYINGYNYKEDLINFHEEIEKAINHVLIRERISAGIGIVEINGSYGDANEIIEDALIASEDALKSNKVIDYSFFDSRIKEKIIREAILKEELSNLANQKLNSFLMFQPVVDLKKNKVVAFEALFRFNSPKYGSVSPLEIIPILEETRLIIEYGDFIIKEALLFLKEARKKDSEIKISINISYIQLIDEKFVRNLLNLVKEMKVDPSSIILELTESVFVDNIHLINIKLRILRNNNFNIAIDDFGTGFSSLSKLRELNVNIIKLDKWFIDRLLNIDINDLLTIDIIRMVHKTNSVMVAEGVEEIGQNDILKQFKCDYAQGYLYSRPLLKEHAITFLENNLKETNK